MPGAWVKVGCVKDLGSCARVEVQGQPIAVFRTDTGVYAIDDICSHEYSRLSEGDVEGDEVACPKHGSRFSLRDGSVVGLPATRPLRTWPAKLEGDEVWIALSPVEV